MRRWVTILAVLIITVILMGGCASYHRVTATPHHEVKTIALGNIKNLTDESRLTTYVRNKLPEQLMLDGALKIRPLGQADRVIDVRIVSYDLQGIGEVRIDSPDRELRQYRSSAYEISVRLEYTLLGYDPNLPPSSPRALTGKALFSELVDIDVVRKDGLRRAVYDACERLVGALTEAW